MKTLCVLCVAMCLAVAGQTGWAADGTWESGADGVWSDTGNWQGDAVADAGATVFDAPGGSGAIAVSNDLAALSLTGLTFNPSGAGAPWAWTLHGQALTLLEPATITVAADGHATVSNSVGGTFGVYKEGTGALWLAGGNNSSSGMVVNAGTLELDSPGELGTRPFRLNGGTLKFRAAGEPGLYESVASPGSGTVNANVIGTDNGVYLSARMADQGNATTETFPGNTQYTYRGRWYVPADGVYSFAKSFDDGGHLMIDGAVIINNSMWSDFVVTRNVRLERGWHAIALRVSQGGGGVGVQLARFTSGIMYDPTNGDFSDGNMANARRFEDDGSGTVLWADFQGQVPARGILGGDAVIDLSDAAGSDFAPFWMNGWYTPADAVGTPVLTVMGGAETLRVGGAAGHAPFDIEVNAPGGVVFEQKVALVRLPTLSAWRIVKGADIAMATDMLFGVGDMRLTNHAVRVLTANPLGRPDAVFYVEDAAFPLYFENARIEEGEWISTDNPLLTISNDVVLMGEGTRVLMRPVSGLRYEGVISGTGTLRKENIGDATLAAANTFTGIVQVAAGTLVSETATIGNVDNEIALQGGALRFGESVTAPSINILSGGNGVLTLAAGQTLSVGELRGNVRIAGAGAVNVGMMAADSTLSVEWAGQLSVAATGGNCAITVKSAADVALSADVTTVTMENAASTLAVAAGATVGRLAVACQPSRLGSLLVQGNGIIAEVVGSYVPLELSGTLTIGNAAGFGGEIMVKAGRVVLDNTVYAYAGNPVLWLDASVDESFTRGRRSGDGGDADLDLLYQWDDRRANGRYARIAGTADAANFDRPYVLPDADLPLGQVVSCGAYTKVKRDEYRRFELSQAITSRYAVVVFGSQDSGGHLLGVTDGASLLFQRGVANDNDNVTTHETPIWKTATYPVWTNGVPVDGQTTGLSGGYQVLTLGLTDSPAVRALGMMNNWRNSGGQRYAEVLFFADELSIDEKRAVESYLAVKWGLGAPTIAAAVTVEPGATLEVKGGATLASLNGTGNVVKTGDGELRFAGPFDGEVTVEGGALAMPPSMLEATADDVPTKSMLLWLDACATDRMTFGTAANSADALLFGAGENLLFQWLDRREGVNRFAWAYYSEQYQERPRLLPYETADGVQRFVVDSGVDTLKSKYMKLSLDVDPTNYQQDTSRSALQNIRTGFVVLDSSRGGGIPLGGGNFTRDNSGTASSPVWGNTAGAQIRNGFAWLDGAGVDGTMTGFDGGVQVLSFTTTAAASFEYLGFSKAGYERLFELIFYSAVLTQAERAQVEAYLLKKWKGARLSYDWTPGDALASSTVTVEVGTRLDLGGAAGGEITAVTGAGTVVVADTAVMPTVDGSIGALEVTGQTCTFTVARQNDTPVALPVIRSVGTLTVPETGTVQVVFEDAVSTATLPLVMYNSFAGTGFADWTITASGTVPNGITMHLKVEADGTYLVLKPKGMVMLLQ